MAIDKTVARSRTPITKFDSFNVLCIEAFIDVSRLFMFHLSFTVAFTATPETTKISIARGDARKIDHRKILLLSYPVRTG